jgi:hypothetical protein
MATFDDLKESAERFADTIDRILDGDFDEYEALDCIAEECDSFKGYLERVEEDTFEEDTFEDDAVDEAVDRLFVEELEEDEPDEKIPEIQFNEPDEPDTFEDLGI